jgi:hypothetical protein
MEHRCGSRQKVEISVRLRSGAGLISRAVVREISISGAWLECPVPIRLNSIVRLVPTSADGRARWGGCPTLEAEVVRSTETGVAIEWLELAPEAIRSVCLAGVAGFDPNSASLRISSGSPRTSYMDPLHVSSGDVRCSSTRKSLRAETS